MLICVALVSYDGGKRHSRRPSALTGLRVVTNDQQITSLQEHRRKTAFEFGFWSGGEMVLVILKSNGVSLTSKQLDEAAKQLINASTNVCESAWAEFNRHKSD